MNRVIQKHELVGIAANLLRSKGYSGTSIDDIAKACGLTKGSLYHHFSGKEELAQAALEQVHQHYREHIFSLVMGHDEPGVAHLRALNAAVEDFFTHHPDGCLLANLSLEGGSSAEVFTRKIRLFFSEWQACYQKVFAGFLGPTQARARAEDALAIVQGCILMNRINPNMQPLRRQHAALVKSCTAGAAPD